MPAGPPDGGTSGDAASPPLPTDTTLACQAQTIVVNRCQGCHAAEPKFGAPMPLVTSADFGAPAVTDDALLVRDMVARRTHDADMPMPPTGMLPDAELAVLDAWLDDGAPDCGETILPDAPIDRTGPEHLPCEPTHTFTAHATGSEERFHVDENAGNLYECFTFRSPFDGTTQATAWAPIIDDERVVHHWILYRTNEPQPDGGVGECNMPRDATFVAGWAPGGENWIMPDDVGLELPGPDQSLILQVHYWNVAGHTDADDASGVAFCTTDEPREHEAGIYTLGSVRIDIPPRVADHEVTGTCASWLTRLLPEPVYALGSFPHMHEYGTSIRTEILRNGDESRMETLVDVDHWDFNDQKFHVHDPPVPVLPGDAIRTTCAYSNTSDTSVRFGERTEDEMCFNFVMIYPIDLFTNNRSCGLI